MVTITTSADKKYIEQADKSLPCYTITCLDNLYSPFDPIGIQLLHFRNDNGAIEWAYDYAKHMDWHTWVIHQDERKVFFINKNTKELWPPASVPKPFKKKGRQDKRNG